MRLTGRNACPTMKQSILIKGGTLLTMDEQDAIVRGDLLIRDGLIASLGETGQTADIVIDSAGCAVLPGFVQTHLHLCHPGLRGINVSNPHMRSQVIRK